MKKKLKVLLLIVFFIALLIMIFVIYNLIKKQNDSEFYELDVTGIIVKNDNEEIFIKNSVDTTNISYSINLGKNKATIKNINGKKINYSKLNIGDKIKIFYKKEKSQILIADTVKQIENIKLIQVIEDNGDNHITKEDIRFSNFLGYFITPTKGKITLKLYPVNVNYTIENFLSKGIKIKIIKKADENDNEDKEIKQFESNEITCRKMLDIEYNIILDTYSFSDMKNLNIGKYQLKIENTNGEIIILPFVINQYGEINWY